jgi:hypothetical protein
MFKNLPNIRNMKVAKLQPVDYLADAKHSALMLNPHPSPSRTFPTISLESGIAAVCTGISRQTPTGYVPSSESMTVYFSQSFIQCGVCHARSPSDTSISITPDSIGWSSFRRAVKKVSAAQNPASRAISIPEHWRIAAALAGSSPLPSSLRISTCPNPPLKLPPAPQQPQTQ